MFAFSFLFLKFILSFAYVCMCMRMCLWMCRCMWRSEESIKYPRVGVSGSHKQPARVSVEQQGLLIGSHPSHLSCFSFNTITTWGKPRNKMLVLSVANFFQFYYFESWTFGRHCPFSYQVIKESWSVATLLSMQKLLKDISNCHCYFTRNWTGCNSQAREAKA